MKLAVWSVGIARVHLQSNAIDGLTLSLIHNGTAGRS
jgi:hypothetical protein